MSCKHLMLVVVAMASLLSLSTAAEDCNACKHRCRSNFDACMRNVPTNEDSAKQKERQAECDNAFAACAADCDKNECKPQGTESTFFLKENHNIGNWARPASSASCWWHPKGSAHPALGSQSTYESYCDSHSNECGATRCVQSCGSSEPAC
jgi:hypothetical protein